MIKICDYIYLNEFEERRDRPNIGVILGKNYNVMVDFGISKNHLDDVYEALDNLDIDYPRVGVLTHYHYDHSFAIPYFKGITIGCKRSNDYLKTLSMVPMSDAFLKSYLSGDSLAFCYNAIKEEYSDVRDIKVKQTDVSFNTYLKLDLGDKVVECYHMPSPHSDDAVYILVKDYLFIGDAFFYDIFNGEKEFDKEKLKAFSVIISSFDCKYIIQGHSPMCTKEELLREIEALL